MTDSQALASTDTRYRFGFDIGGTFTDFVLIDTTSGDVQTYKALTTKTPSDAVMQGWKALLERVGASGADVENAIHGTTLITNALIERKGSKTAFLTTTGFKDVLEMAREMRYDIYDLLMVLPEPLVQRQFRLELHERLDAKGNVVTALDLGELDRMRPVLEAGNLEAVAGLLLACLHQPCARTTCRRLVRQEPSPRQRLHIQ